MKSIIFFLEFEGLKQVINMAPHTGAKRYAGHRTFFNTGPGPRGPLGVGAYDNLVYLYCNI